MPAYSRSGGRPLALGAELGRGGEGAVFAVADDAGMVAKLFKQATPERVAKIQAMLANPPDDPTRAQGHASLAWPTELVTAAGGVPAGYLMPRLDPKTAVQFLRLYVPKTRQQVAPAFTWQYLVRTARNLASATAALHERGYVVGDLNESNIFVANTALVTLIDCDSMQVPAANAVYRCTVRKDDYTPPELFGVNLHTTSRTPEHDAFALAVLLFLLLMEGVHPFAGVWQGGGNPPDLATRIQGGFCPHVPRGAGVIHPQPAALPFTALPSGLQRLFVRCFGDGHTRPAARPTAHEWLAELAQCEQRLIPCARNRQHIYADHLQACPWCARLARGLPDPFPPPVRAGRQAPLPAVSIQTTRSGVVRNTTAPANPFSPPLQSASPRSVGTSPAPAQLGVFTPLPSGGGGNPWGSMPGATGLPARRSSRQPVRTVGVTVVLVLLALVVVRQLDSDDQQPGGVRANQRSPTVTVSEVLAGAALPRRGVITASPGPGIMAGGAAGGATGSMVTVTASPEMIALRSGQSGMVEFRFQETGGVGVVFTEHSYRWEVPGRNTFATNGGESGDLPGRVAPYATILLTNQPRLFGEVFNSCRGGIAVLEKTWRGRDDRGAAVTATASLVVDCLP